MPNNLLRLVEIAVEDWCEECSDIEPDCLLLLNGEVFGWYCSDCVIEVVDRKRLSLGIEA